MGWRGAIRSIAAAQRAAQRAAIRQQRQYEKMSKQQAKLAALQQAAFEVDQHENLLERITTVHRDCGQVWNWQEIAATPPPPNPIENKTREETSRRKLDDYKPSWFDKLFRRTEKRRAALASAIVTATKADAQEYRQAISEFDHQYGDWPEMRDLAKRILASDPNAFREAVDELSPFQELTDLGSGVQFVFRNDGTADATLKVSSDSIVPSEAKSLLQSGKLSVKKMSPLRASELYQDYVAGAVLRIARELFALLPLETVSVTAVSNMLDTTSGHLTDQPILTALIPRATLDTLNFDALDPSDALKNFKYQMDFKKSSGFVPIHRSGEPQAQHLSAESGQNSPRRLL
jgi:hypothetical protein